MAFSGLRIRRLGVRVALGAPEKSLAVAEDFACRWSAHRGQVRDWSAFGPPEVALKWRNEGAADHEMTTSRRVQSLEQHRRRRRAELLIPEVAFELQAAGTVVSQLDDPADVEMWREAGPLAGRRLGRHVRTGSTRCGCADRDGSHVWMVDLNHEVSEAEQRRSVPLLSAVDGVRRLPEPDG